MIDNYTEFWDFYIQEHSKPLTRILHFIGTSLGLILLVLFIWRGIWYYFPVCLMKIFFYNEGVDLAQIDTSQEGKVSW